MIKALFLKVYFGTNQNNKIFRKLQILDRKQRGSQFMLNEFIQKHDL
jgi:hypothetical protein